MVRPSRKNRSVKSNINRVKRNVRNVGSKMAEIAAKAQAGTPTTIYEGGTWYTGDHVTSTDEAGISSVRTRMGGINEHRLDRGSVRGGKSKNIVKTKKPRTRGGVNFSVEMKGKTGLGLNPKDYTVYRKPNGDVVVVDKGYRRSKKEMKWKKVGSDSITAQTVSKMMVHDVQEGVTYRFNKASRSIAETEFLKPASRSWLGQTEQGWIDIRTGEFIARTGIRKFKGSMKGDLEYEFASIDMSSIAVILEGVGFEEWYSQLSGIEKALVNQHFSMFDWENFWQVYFVTSPPEKTGHIDEKAEMEGWRVILDETNKILPGSYEAFVRNQYGDAADEFFE